MEKTGCKIICGAPTTLVVKGLMMMMMRTRLSEPVNAQHGLYRKSATLILQSTNCDHATGWAKLAPAERPVTVEQASAVKLQREPLDWHSVDLSPADRLLRPLRQAK